MSIRLNGTTSPLFTPVQAFGVTSCRYWLVDRGETIPYTSGLGSLASRNYVFREDIAETIEMARKSMRIILTDEGPRTRNKAVPGPRDLPEHSDGPED